MHAKLPAAPRCAAAYIETLGEQTSPAARRHADAHLSGLPRRCGVLDSLVRQDPRREFPVGGRQASARRGPRLRRRCPPRTGDHRRRAVHGSGVTSLQSRSTLARRRLPAADDDTPGVDTPKRPAGRAANTAGWASTASRCSSSARSASPHWEVKPALVYAAALIPHRVDPHRLLSSLNEPPAIYRRGLPSPRPVPL